MASPNLNFPFGFAYVSALTPFDPSLFVGEENIFAFRITHEEGQCATLEIDIKNPREGLNNPGRLQWCWFSGLDPLTGHVVALFHGRQISFPTDFLGNAITLKFVAMPLDFLAQKQAFAEANLTGLPFFDPVFVDAGHRLDPDSYLEARSAYWHVDRIFLSVTTSDVIVGEDGLQVFQMSDAFWESVKVSIDKPPLRSVYCEATVSWNQQATGLIDMGVQSITTYGGDAIISAWPKPLSSIGAGWIVQYSAAVDVWNTAKTPTVTITASYRNQEKTHQYGDTMSYQLNWTKPQFRGPYYNAKISTYNKIAIIDPDPDGFNDPTAEVRYTDIWVGQWQIQTALVLRYEASRQRTEQVRFTLNADLQPVFTDPGGVAANFAQDSQFLSLQGSVGIEGPYGTFRGNWAASTQYSLYDYFMVGTQAYQVLRDHLSATVFDPLQTATIWQPFTIYGSGENVEVGLLTYVVLVSHISKAGFSATQLDMDGNLIYELRIDPHSGPRLYQTLANFRGNWASGTVYVTNDIFIGPDGNNYNVQIGHVASSPFNPFATDVTGRLLLGLLLNPAPIGDVARRSYFPQDRGNLSIEYLILRARAQLLLRSRAVRISFEAYFWECAYMTCRKNATLYDHRLPGGVATGKVIGYTLSASEGIAPIAQITMACCVGTGAILTPITGGPAYADINYVDPGWQAYSGSFNPLAPGDVSFAPPIDAPVDDGLIFPLSKADVVLSETVPTASMAAEEQVLLTQAYYGIQLQEQAQANAGDPIAFATLIDQYHQAQTTAFADALAKTPVWYQLVLKPVVNGPFSTEYDVDVSDLVVPMDINLAAPSSP